MTENNSLGALAGIVPGEKRVQASPVYSKAGSAGLGIAHIAGNVYNVILPSITDGRHRAREIA